jgi:hypothetical protein
MPIQSKFLLDRQHLLRHGTFFQRFAEKHWINHGAKLENAV